MLPDGRQRGGVPITGAEIRCQGGLCATHGKGPCADAVIGADGFVLGIGRGDGEKKGENDSRQGIISFGAGPSSDSGRFWWCRKRLWSRFGPAKRVKAPGLRPEGYRARNRFYRKSVPELWWKG